MKTSGHVNTGWLAVVLAALLLVAGAGCRYLAEGKALRPVKAAGAEENAAVAANATFDQPLEKRPLPDLGALSSLPQVLDYAFLSSGELEAAYREWRAALARVPQAGALNDPRLEFGFLFSPGAFDTFRSIVDNVSLMLTREFSASGKRDAKAEQALAQARAAGERFIAARYRLQTRVVRAYAALALTDFLREQNAATLRLLHQSDEVAGHRLHAMDVASPTTLADLEKIAVEIKSMESEQRSLEIVRRSQRAELNGVLNRPPDAVLAAVILPVVDTPAVPAAELFSRAVAQNPELAALRQEVAAAGAAQVLAKLEAKPDYDLGLGLDTTLVPTVKAGMTLPVNRTRIRAGIAEALATRQAAEARYRAAATDVQARVVMALAGIEDADRILRDYAGSIVPATRKLLDSQLAAYGSGGGDLLAILDTERVLVDFQRLTLRARTDRLRYYADLEELLGAPLLQLGPAQNAGAQTK